MSKPNIFILPENLRGDPEVVAMLQAFYSRSILGIEDRLADLGHDLSSIKKALNKYLLGYGHASIGDCATIPVFLEGISILAAKAVQDSPLFNGQECSTRYIELSGECYAPVDENAPNVEIDIRSIQQQWLSHYHLVYAALVKAFKHEFPIYDYYPNHVEGSVSADNTRYEGAVKAKAFDIARALIPSGALTNTSWNATLRKLREHSIYMAGHPLAEVRSLARDILERSGQEFPYGMVGNTSLKENDEALIDWHLSHPQLYYATSGYPQNSFAISTVVDSLSSNVIDLIASMPMKRCGLPKSFDPLYQVRTTGLIDFGCWRDLQRHRNGACTNPVVGFTGSDTEAVMHPWYLRQIERYCGAELADRVTTLMSATSNLHVPALHKQYAMPLGVCVPFDVTYGLSQLLYFVRLRSSDTVHPILRHMAQMLGKHVQQSMCCNINYDDSVLVEGLSLKRADQTIKAKDGATV